MIVHFHVTTPNLMVLTTTKLVKKYFVYVCLTTTLVYVCLTTAKLVKKYLVYVCLTTTKLVKKQLI